MDQCLSFKDLATSIEPFNPSFTEDFCKYMKESIRRSQIAAFKAERSAAKILIT